MNGDRNVKYDYFDYNGKRYYSGTKIKIYNQYYKGIFKDIIVIFQYRTDTHIRFKYINGNKKNYIECLVHQLDNIVCDIIYPINERTQIYMEEKKIELYSNDVIICGWVWYIFIMAFLSICHFRIICWIIATLVFWMWRAYKI